MLRVSHPGACQTTSTLWYLPLDSKYVNLCSRPCRVTIIRASRGFQVHSSFLFSGSHCHHQRKIITMLENNSLLHDTKIGPQGTVSKWKMRVLSFEIKQMGGCPLGLIQEGPGDGGPDCTDILNSRLTPLVHLHAMSAPRCIFSNPTGHIVFVLLSSLLTVSLLLLLSAPWWH